MFDLKYIDNALAIMQRAPEEYLSEEEEDRLLHYYFPLIVKELHEARDIVAFFAKKENWQSPSTGFTLQYDPEPSPVNAKGYNLAHNFIYKDKKDKEET